MTFTEEQETALKLIANELIARKKMTAADNIMGNEIRASNKTEDTRIRERDKPIWEPLHADWRQSRQAIKDAFGDPGVIS